MIVSTERYARMAPFMRDSTTPAVGWEIDYEDGVTPVILLPACAAWVTWLPEDALPGLTAGWRILMPEQITHERPVLVRFDVTFNTRQRLRVLWSVAGQADLMPLSLLAFANRMLLRDVASPAHPDRDGLLLLNPNLDEVEQFDDLERKLRNPMLLDALREYVEHHGPAPR